MSEGETMYHDNAAAKSALAEHAVQEEPPGQVLRSLVSCEKLVEELGYILSQMDERFDAVLTPAEPMPPISELSEIRPAYSSVAERLERVVGQLHGRHLQLRTFISRCDI